MADNKQYITRVQENGRVMISEDVVAAIAVHSLSDIEGFAGLATKPGSDIVEFIGKKAKGIKVSITENNELEIDCNVLIAYGQSVVTMAKSIQQTISGAVESTTNAKVLSVNVNVCGIVKA